MISLFDLIAWSVGVYPVSKVDKPDIESESEFKNANNIILLSFTKSFKEILEVPCVLRGALLKRRLENSVPFVNVN